MLDPSADWPEGARLADGFDSMMVAAVAAGSAPVWSVDCVDDVVARLSGGDWSAPVWSVDWDDDVVARLSGGDWLLACILTSTLVVLDAGHWDILCRDRSSPVRVTLAKIKANEVIFREKTCEDSNQTRKMLLKRKTSLLYKTSISASAKTERSAWFFCHALVDLSIDSYQQDLRLPDKACLFEKSFPNSSYHV